MIGVFATLISTVLAIVFGAVSGCAPEWVDSLLMRFTEIFLSIPNLLAGHFIAGSLRKNQHFQYFIYYRDHKLAKYCQSGAHGSKTDPKQRVCHRKARCMGGSFRHVLWKHLTPNFASSIMFMVVMNIRSAIIAESTLSFMGIGLPLEQISWGSMLSNADKALMTKSWWIILIPGLFLTATLMCMTNLGNYLRKAVNRKESYL